MQGVPGQRIRRMAMKSRAGSEEERQDKETRRHEAVNMNAAQGRVLDSAPHNLEKFALTPCASASL